MYKRLRTVVIIFFLLIVFDKPGKIRFLLKREIKIKLNTGKKNNSNKVMYNQTLVQKFDEYVPDVIVYVWYSVSEKYLSEDFKDTFL